MDSYVLKLKVNHVIPGPLAFLRTNNSGTNNSGTNTSGTNTSGTNTSGTNTGGQVSYSGANVGLGYGTAQHQGFVRSPHADDRLQNHPAGALLVYYFDTFQV